MELLLISCFIVKHFVADFPISMQTPWMFMNKGTYGHPGGLAHAGIHAAGSAVLLGAVAGALSYPTKLIWLLLVLLAFEFLVHYHMDWWKMWWGKRQGYKPSTHPEFWTWLGLDQMVHYLTYVVMVWVWV